MLTSASNCRNKEVNSYGKRSILKKKVINERKRKEDRVLRRNNNQIYDIECGVIRMGNTDNEDEDMWIWRRMENQLVQISGQNNEGIVQTVEEKNQEAKHALYCVD